MTGADEPVADRPAQTHGATLSDRGFDEPRPDRLTPDHPQRTEILAAHRRAIEAGQPGYLDPVTGLFVLTAAYLADRGVCCDTGCRHCPYVP